MRPEPRPAGPRSAVGNARRRCLSCPCAKVPALGPAPGQGGGGDDGGRRDRGPEGGHGEPNRAADSAQAHGEGASAQESRGEVFADPTPWPALPSGGFPQRELSLEGSDPGNHVAFW